MSDEPISVMANKRYEPAFSHIAKGPQLSAVHDDDTPTIKLTRRFGPMIKQKEGNPISDGVDVPEVAESIIILESGIEDFVVSADHFYVAEPIEVPLIDPPQAGQLILRFIMSKDGREAAIGDLAAEFAECVEKHGRREAHWQYWGEIVRSVGKRIWPVLMKALFVEVILKRIGL